MTYRTVVPSTKYIAERLAEDGIDMLNIPLVESRVRDIFEGVLRTHSEGIRPKCSCSLIDQNILEVQIEYPPIPRCVELKLKF